MSEEETVNSEQLPVISDEKSRLEAGGMDSGRMPELREGQETVEKLVPVSEAIRYRKRAQAAEKELSELKELHEKQTEELAVIRAGSVSDRMGQDDGTTQDSHRGANASRSDASQKTQGVKETRTSGARNVLQTAARQAASSGSRNDVQEYLRVRRNYV